MYLHCPRCVAAGVLLAVVLSYGTALSTPVISVAPDSSAFPPTEQGQSWPGVATVSNTGDTDLIVVSATTTDPVFRVSTWQYPIVVPPGGMENILFFFEPVEPVFYSGYLVIESNDPVTPVAMIPMTGQGLLGPPPEIQVVPTSIPVGVYSEGQASSPFQIYNHGYQTLQFSIDDSGFPAWLGVSPTSGSVVRNGAAPVSVYFDATGIPEDSTLSHTFYIDHNDTSTASVAFNVQMTTLPPPMPEISLSDTAFVFADRFVPNGATVVLWIYNTGSDPLTGTIVSPSSHYIVSDPTFSVSPGFQHGTSIDFDPPASGVYAETLSVYSNDLDEGLIRVPLYGRAVDLSEFTVTPDSIAGTLGTGASREFDLEIVHPGGFDTGFVLSTHVVHPLDPQGIAVAPAPDSAERTPSVVSSSLSWETGEHPGGDGLVTAERARPPAAAPSIYTPLPFSDGFEDGDYAGWQSGGGTAVHQITSTTAANGTAFSLRESQSILGHSNGLFLEFGFARLTNVSFWVRAATITDNACYVTFHDRDGQEVIFFFALQSGQFYINANVGGNTSVAYQADTWYHVELRNIDFDTQSFDYYIDDALIQAAVPFRNAGSITNIARMDVYNFSDGATGYWDEFDIHSDFPTWMTVGPDTVMVPAGGTKAAAFSVDATGLPAGTYKGYVDVNSVDRAVTIATVPITLVVDSTATAVRGVTPLATSLEQNYPNPFNPTTNIAFFVAGAGRAELTVFDVRGRRVRTLFSRERALGRYMVTWDGRDGRGARVASGIYFYRLRTAEGATTRKMVLLK